MQLPDIKDLTLDFDQINIKLISKSQKTMGEIKYSLSKGLLKNRGKIMKYDSQTNSLQFHFSKFKQMI